MPQHFLSYYFTPVRAGDLFPSNQTNLPCIAREAGGKQAWEADFLAGEIAPSSVVYRLSGIKPSKQQKSCKRRTVYATAA